MAQIEIQDLKKTDVAKLLMTVCPDHKNLKEFKSYQELSEHRLFSKISLRPESIIQLVPLLNEKSLDEIAKQMDKEERQELEESGTLMTS